MNEAVSNLKAIAPSPQHVDSLQSELEEEAYVKAYREVLRLQNVLETFTEFSYSDICITTQEMADYRSKYLDLYDKVKNSNEKEKVSILNDLDFELELIHRDKINVRYIISLLQAMVGKTKIEQARLRKVVLDSLDGEIELRSKRQLIEQFMDKHLVHVTQEADVSEAFEAYWDAQREKAMTDICETENINIEAFKKVYRRYVYTSKPPIGEDIVSALNERPKLKERRSTIERIIQKIKDFVQTFLDGID